MVLKGRKVERVIYEEKPHCGRCGAGIIGVIPKRWDGKPLCRECAFELEQMALKTGGKIVMQEEKAPPTPEEIARRTTLIIILAIVVVIFLFRIYTLAPLLAPPKPLRLGVQATDGLTDKCIDNLWVLSRDLQMDKLPDILPLCPKSSKQYVVTELAGDTVISCPTPQEHGLTRLSVSLSLPIPFAVGEEEQ